MQIEPGTLIGERYRVERELGKGGMGAVYVAFDTRFDKRVAVKVTLAAGAAHEQIRARFKREAMIGNDLGAQSGVVRAFDWGELPPSGLYLAMDLVPDARPLDLASGTLGERLARLRAAAELVQRAHQAGVVHRDLKPANVLQDAAGGLHLTDFGIAKVTGGGAEPGSELTGGLTQSGVGMGTPFFMAPEQCADAKSVDQRCDVFALGVMLFRALTGHYPFAGSSLTEVMRKHLAVEAGTQPAPRPRNHDPDLPEALDALCAQAIHVDPAERLGDVGELLAGLDAALGEVDTTPAAAHDAEAEAGSAPTGAAEALVTGALGAEAPTLPPQPRSSGAGAGVAAVVLALLVALGAGGYALYVNRGDPPPTPPKTGLPGADRSDPYVPPEGAGQPTIDPGKVGVRQDPVEPTGDAAGTLVPGAPVLQVRRLDERCYVGWTTDVALEVQAEGPVTVIGPDRFETEGIEPGKEPTLEETIGGKAGIQTWTYVAVDGQGRKSAPVSLEVEVKPPALKASAQKLGTYVGDVAEIRLELVGGGPAKVCDASNDDSVCPLQGGESQVVMEGLSGKAGARSFRYYAVDEVGNRSAVVEVPYTVAAPLLSVRQLGHAYAGGRVRLELSVEGGGRVRVTGSAEVVLTPDARSRVVEVACPEGLPKLPLRFVATDDSDNKGEPVTLTLDVVEPQVSAAYRAAIARARKLPGLTYLGAELFEGTPVAQLRQDQTGLIYHLIPGGVSAPGLQGPAYEVEPFLLCATECTAGAFAAVAALPEQSSLAQGLLRAPVHNVSWTEAVAWCQRVGARLPTAREWEYACRAGTDAPFCFGREPQAKLGDYAEYEANNGRGAVAVGGKRPNGFGLYDVHGNVWEWCQDGHLMDLDRPGAPERRRVLRGGSFNSSAAACEASALVYDVESARAANFGFRPAISLP